MRKKINRHHPIAQKILRIEQLEKELELNVASDSPIEYRSKEYPGKVFKSYGLNLIYEEEVE